MSKVLNPSYKDFNNHSYYSNGVMLLMFQPVNGDKIPMTLINVHNGKALMNLAIQGDIR